MCHEGEPAVMSALKKIEKIKINTFLSCLSGDEMDVTFSVLSHGETVTVYINSASALYAGGLHEVTLKHLQALMPQTRATF